MLAGFLTVLKIIGIVLLWILLIVLFLILLVLFVPVRYKADVDIPETELDNGFDVEKIQIKAGFSWLLHLLTGGIDYPASKEFTVKVFGIRVFPRKNKEEDNDFDGNIDKKSNENVDNYADKEEAHSSDNNFDDLSEESSSNFTENSENETEDKALIEIITDIFEKIENILKTPQTVLEKIQYTISRVCGKIGMIKNTLENDIFKRAFSLVKRKLIRILKMILPDRIRADILFGTGDPADTAEVLAAYSALYPMLYKKVSYEPDFDRKVLKGDIHVKGHITLFTILYCVLVCYFNKDVKKTIKRFKKIFAS